MGTDPKQPSKKGFKVNDRRWWLKEGAESEDIPDPIGGTKDEYEAVFEKMEDYLEEALPKILEMAEKANE